MTKRTRIGAAIVITAGLLLSACGSGGSGGGRLSLVAFSVAQAPYDVLQKDFAATDAGKGVSWKSSYGASGDQSRAVESGAAADYVHFSLEGDVTRLVDAGLVAKDWDQGPTKGIVSRSVVVFVVRKGNPKHITTWDDLVKPGVGIVSPNPGSSGSARWNILAAYGQVLAQGGSKSEAKAYLKQFFENVVSLPGSGREATTTFTGGTGDVLISYENEAIAARQNDTDVDYVVPDATLLIENPAAVTKAAPTSAKAFLDYALSKDGQEVFASKGFRPAIDGVKVEVKGANDPKDPFPVPTDLFTIADTFGGWSKASAEFFDEDEGLVPAIQKQTGKS
jgi:sulfate/thiosulfate-binding protein